jgi:hypothetical protein
MTGTHACTVDISEVRTGDVLLFSSNTSTGFVLKTFTSSMWNHAGIAVRISDSDQVTTDGSGKLYVLEINTWERTDAITGDKVKGAAYSDYDWVKTRYNLISFRRMNDKYRTEAFVDKLRRVVDATRGCKFTQDISPFISVWLGVQLDGDHRLPRSRPHTMFCSEYMAYIYCECLELGDNSMADIFGYDGPHIPSLCSPKHYSSSVTPNSKIFQCKDVVIHRFYSSPESVLTPILVITFFFIALMYSSFK